MRASLLHEDRGSSRCCQQLEQATFKLESAEFQPKQASCDMEGPLKPCQVVFCLLCTSSEMVLSDLSQRDLAA